MSYETILKCTNDADLRGRIKVAQQKEAIYNPKVSNPQQMKDNPERFISDVLWPLSFSEEVAYEYAINTGHKNPGADPSVITDGAILSAVVTYWPGGMIPDVVNTPLAQPSPVEVVDIGDN